MESLAKLLRGLREQMIAKEGIEAADLVLPQWQIDSALSATEQARQEFQEAEPTNLYSQTNPGGVMSFTQEQLDAATAAARKEAEDKSKAEFAAKETELSKLRGERQAERIKTRIDGWKIKGIVTPAEEAGLAEFMASLEDGVSVEFSFSAPDKTTVKKTPEQFFADFMAARKPLVKLGKTTDENDDLPGGPADPQAIANDAQDYMSAQAAKGITVSLQDAVTYASKKAGQ
jgi:hypothetical protein